MNYGGVASGLRGSCRGVRKLDARAEEPGEDEEQEEGADGEGHGRGHHVHAHAAALWRGHCASTRLGLSATLFWLHGRKSRKLIRRVELYGSISWSG